MRFSSYFYASLFSMLIMVYYAYYTQRQFYPTVLFLVSSKVSFILLANMLLAIALVVAKLFKAVYFGQLRDTEVELLIEKAKFAIPETCLALTIFRNELSGGVFALFGALIFVKLLHKLSKSRLEYLEQIMPVPVASQLRFAFLLCSLIFIDVVSCACSVLSIKKLGRNVLILFGFEFGLLLVYAVNLSARFIIQVCDSYMMNGLLSKGLYLMLVDLFSDAVKLITYICFFILVFSNYGMPIHILREVWTAFTSFQRKLINFIQYLRLTRNLDSRFPDATVEEIESAGDCLVCRETMETGKKLPCGHVFHLDCLRMWLQHQQSCPLCRADIPVENNVQNNQEPQPQQELVRDMHVDVPGRAPVPDGQNAGVPVDPVGRLVENNLARTSLTTSESFPQFFVVVGSPYVAILVDPIFSSTEVRRIKTGTIIFVTSRVLGTDGTRWLRAPDGWVVEANHDESVNSVFLKPLNDPGLKKSVNETDRDSATKGPSVEGLMKSEKSESINETMHSLQKMNLNLQYEMLVSKRQDESMKDLETYDSDKLKKIFTIQAHVQATARSLIELSESVRQCQKILAEVIQDEIKEIRRKNSVS